MPKPTPLPKALDMRREEDRNWRATHAITVLLDGREMGGWIAYDKAKKEVVMPRISDTGERIHGKTLPLTETLNGKVEVQWA